MLRTAKLTVADEIENALSYYRATFLRADPEAVPRDRGARCPATRSRPFFRMGNWIGGDRDGNPNRRRADTLRMRAARARARRRCAST